MEKLNVFYRICPYASVRSILYGVDKLTQVKVFLKSFLDGFKAVDYKITFILDSCPPEYKKAIQKMCKREVSFYEENDMGNKGSFMKQVELISQLKYGEKVYLAEDDYLYLPDSGKKLMEELRECEYVTLYDHPDYAYEPHTHFPHHSFEKNHLIWVSRMSTCLTFGTTAGNINQNRKIFEKYGVNDFELWSKITENYELYSPVPSLATHAVVGLLAPNIDWQI